jgi:hypothetical protein
MRTGLDGALSGLGRFRKQEGYGPICFKLEREINVVDLLFEVANDNGSYPKMSGDYSHSDSRLRRWDDYVSENCPIPHVSEQIAPSMEALEAKAGFFLYFGAIHPRRNRDVEVQ